MDPEDENIEIPDTDEVKLFIKQCLPPHTKMFNNDFFNMTMIPTMFLKNISDLYGCGTVDAPFIRVINSEASEAVIQFIMAVVWLTLISCECSSFTRSIIDQFKKETDIVRLKEPTQLPEPFSQFHIMIS